MGWDEWGSENTLMSLNGKRFLKKTSKTTEIKQLHRHSVLLTHREFIRDFDAVKTWRFTQMCCEHIHAVSTCTLVYSTLCTNTNTSSTLIHTHTPPQSTYAYLNNNTHASTCGCTHRHTLEYSIKECTHILHCWSKGIWRCCAIKAIMRKRITQTVKY